MTSSEKKKIKEKLQSDRVVILDACDVFDAIEVYKTLDEQITMTMLDPWYNKGVGGVREDYDDYIFSVINQLGGITEHLYLWGFPEIVAAFVKNAPAPLQFQNWITWFYKNNPSVIRGWRSSQQACLHYSLPGTKMYPEHFLNEEQKERLRDGKMRFIPGPTSVIEESLLVGFIGKKEQTGHPAQKPLNVYEKLLLMTTKEGDLVVDPMAGSGTLGEIALKHNRRVILSDMSSNYIKIMEERLGVKRMKILKSSPSVFLTKKGKVLK